MSRRHQKKVPGTFLRGRHHLFWRVYLHGALLLVTATIVVGIVAWLAGDQDHFRRRVPQYFTDDLAPLVDDPAALGNKLERIHESFEVDISTYDAGGTLIGAAGDAVALHHRKHSWEKGHIFRLDIGDAGAVAMVRLRQRDHTRLLMILIAVMLLLGLVSFPFARAISRPIERLTETARKLGAGDLSARTGIKRRGEVGVLARSLDEMAERLEQLLQSEKELLANVSHELRTPLSRIRVALELAEESGDAAAGREKLAGIGDDLAELEQLIADTLTLTRLDLSRDAQLSIDRQPIHIAELIENTRRRFERAHPERELQIEGATGQLSGDAVLLRRVLDNLLDNAARYSEQAPGPVELRLAHIDSDVRIEVRDRGVGLSDEDRQRVFEPFFRADPSRNRNSGGVGLGLALCRRIIEAHGGQIGVEPCDGGGSVFWLVVPASR